MDLCLAVYDILTRYKYQDKILQIVPVPEPGFTIHDERTIGGSIDIALNKPSYLAIFKQAHDYWHQYRHLFMDLSPQPTVALWQLYKVTVAYLFTTNDHHMIMKLHEQIIMELYRRGHHDILWQEFEIITTLVSSKLAKINKNSLLWHMIKKLTIILIINDDMDDTVLINRLFKACQYHFSNYYAGEFLQWYIKVNAASQRSNAYIEQQLVTHCRRDLQDVTLWTSFKHYLTNDIKIILDYNLIIDDINAKYHLTLPYLTDQSQPIDHASLISSQINWLFVVKCSAKTPYILMIDHIRPLITHQLKVERGKTHQQAFPDQIDFITTLSNV